MYFEHLLFHIEQQYREQSILSSVHNIGMDIPNLLNCLILSRAEPSTKFCHVPSTEYFRPFC